MPNVIKDTYKLYLRKLPIWILFVLPLVLYSLGDDYLRSVYFEKSFYFKLSFFLGLLVYTAVEIAIYKYVLKAKIGKVWGFVKKWMLFFVIQFVMGFVMMIPMFVLSGIVNHHNVAIYWVPLGLIANIFLGIWLFAKVNVVLPMIIKGDKITFKSFFALSKGKYLSWVLVSALIYFPYIASYYLISNNVINVVVTSFLAILLCLFNSLYYQSKTSN